MSEIYSPGSIAGPPATFLGPYNATVVYAVGQAVSLAGSSYVSLVGSNLGNNPATSPASWGLLAAAGAAGASMSITLTFAAAGSQTVAHGLDTMVPLVQASVSSGATRWFGTAIDANNYKVTATGPMVAQFVFLGGTVSTATAPVVTLNPAAWSGASTGTLSFTAAATGSPYPTVQWQTDSGSSGATWTNIGGATSTTYSAPAAGKGGWQYRAVFTNASGSATTTAATATVAASADITTGLVNYWPMNEGTGSTFIDAIAGNNLAATGVAWTGTEASFTEANGPSTSGSGAQTTTQPVPLSNATSPFTISAWVNIAATNGYLIASTDEGHSGWEFRFTDTNVLRLILWSGATPVMWAGGPVTNFTTGIRQNILTTYDGSGHASGIKVYVNGTLIASTVVNDSLAGATISPTQPFTIMAEPLDGMMVNSVLGTMDHLRIFNRVLAAGDIALIQTESI